MTTNNSIAIIGGMGPQATAKLYQLIISKVTSQHKDTLNSDFPHIVIDSLTVDDFIGSQESQQQAVVAIKQSLRRLSAFRPTSIGLSCNTAHLLADRAGLLDEPNFVSLIDAVVDSVDNLRLTKVGLLASPTTIKTGLYERTLADKGIDCVTTGAAGLVATERIIKNVISGEHSQIDISTLNKLTEDMIEKGSEGMVLGCTELPIIFDKRQSSVPVFDSLDILASALLQKHRAAQITEVNHHEKI